MDKRAQRIAIAEACGWGRVGNPNQPLDEYWSKDVVYAVVFEQLPDYLNSLEEMCKIEKSLGTIQVMEYNKTLLEVFNSGTRVSSWDRHAGDYIWHARPEQRAEAFLKTIGKWVDSK